MIMGSLKAIVRVRLHAGVPPTGKKGPLSAVGQWDSGFGAALILGEIISAQVLLSQIGNILILVAGIGFARRLGSQAE
jgi:hypothetical protein